MSQDGVDLRQSPFLFFIRFTVAQFFATVLVIVFFVAPQIAAAYTATSLDEQVLDYPWVIVIGYTLLQLLLTSSVFITWYFPVYRVINGQVRWRRGATFAEQKLVDLAPGTTVGMRQSWLGRQLDYGTITLTAAGGAATTRMKNLSHPQSLVDVLASIIAERTASTPPLLNTPLTQLIECGENQHTEFKASLMWDYRKQSVNKELYEPVMKNLVAFMNTTGGELLIGIGDDGEVLGIEQDMSSLKKPNIDGFENVFNVAFANMVGMENRQYVDVSFPQMDGKTLCRLTVRPAAHPVYLRYQGKEELYVRTGNSSQALAVSKAVQYVAGRFG